MNEVARSSNAYLQILSNLHGKTAFRVFWLGFPSVQFFKRHNESINPVRVYSAAPPDYVTRTMPTPEKTYENPVVNAAIENPMEYLRSKADSLYCYVVLYKGFRYRPSMLKSLGALGSRPTEAFAELQSFLCGCTDSF